MLDPRCCFDNFPLQKATKIVAIIDMGISALSIIFLGFLIILVLFNGTEIDPSPVVVPTTPSPPSNTSTTTSTESPDALDTLQMSEGTIVTVLIFGLCYAIAIFYLSRFLLHATMARDYYRVHQWYVIAVVLFVIRVAMYLMGLAFSIAFFASLGILGFVYQAYCIWVVVAFKKELALGQDYRTDETLYLRHGGNMQYFKF